MELIQAGEPGRVAAYERIAERQVGQYLGGAHENGTVSIDGCVADGQTNFFGSEQLDQLEELLGHERFDRSGPD